MKPPGKNITVVFLMFMPYGFDKFRTFIDSYTRHPAGVRHGLVILFKQAGDKATLDRCRQLLGDLNISYTPLYFDQGLDIDAYRFAAQRTSSDLFFFLNTNSVLLGGNWLLHMYAAMTRDNAGMVSATGSWQSYRETPFVHHPLQYEKDKGLAVNFRKYKLFIKALIYYPFLFKSFPNPHLRTNAFMIRRDVFLAIRYKPLTSKFRAYQCESGRNSVTSQVIKQGYGVYVVDRNGQVYEPQKWPESRTFWIDNQENLLVEDNQTRQYATGDNTAKRLYSRLAWHRPPAGN